MIAEALAAIFSPCVMRRKLYTEKGRGDQSRSESQTAAQTAVLGLYPDSFALTEK